MNNTESATPQLDLVAEAVGAFIKVCYRYRGALAPLFTSAGVVIAGVVIGGQWPWVWPLAFLTALVVIGWLWTIAPTVKRQGWVKWALPPRFDRNRKGILDSASEQWYFTAVVGYIGVWLSAYIATAWNTYTLAGWAAGTLAAWYPWWRHHRIRRPSDYWMKQWRWARDTIRELAGSKLLRTGFDGPIVKLTVELARGVTLEMVARRVPAMCSALRLRVGAITLEQVPDRQDRIIVRVVNTDEFTKNIPHPLDDLIADTPPLTLVDDDEEAAA
jgi:hypothetical protein